MGSVDNSQFYFVCYADKEHKVLTVVDLDHCVDYERSEFAYVNAENFENHLIAIKYARKLAEKYNLGYEMFDSRYDESLNEYLELDND